MFIVINMGYHSPVILPLQDVGVKYDVKSEKIMHSNAHIQLVLKDAPQGLYLLLKFSFQMNS